MDSLPIRQKGVINWLLMYQKYHNTWANRCSSTFTVTILNYLSVRFLQQLLLGNFKFRIYPQMFAKTTFILKDGWTSARVSLCHIAASQHAASIAARSPIHARVLYIVLNLNLEINISMCVTHGWTVERWNAMPACKHARTQQLYVTGRETWWAPSLWRGVVARRLFHKKRGDPPRESVLGTVISKACAKVGSRPGAGTVPKAVLSLARQGRTRMGEMSPVLPPLEALARACPAHPGKRDILASISG